MYLPLARGPRKRGFFELFGALQIMNFSLTFFDLSCEVGLSLAQCFYGDPLDPLIPNSPHLDFEKSGFSRPDHKLFKNEVKTISVTGHPDFLEATCGL